MSKLDVMKAKDSNWTLVPYTTSDALIYEKHGINPFKDEKNIFYPLPEPPLSEKFLNELEKKAENHIL